MFHSFKAALLALAVLALGSGLHATDFDLGKAGKLSVTVPAGWTATARVIGDSGRELSLVSKANANAKALLTVFTPATPLPPATEADLDRNFTELCKRYVPQSVERKTVLTRYKLAQGYGVYALFTDATLVGLPPKRGDYKVMAPGFIKLTDSVQLIVTLYADDAAGPEMTALRSAVESLRLTPPKS